MLQVWRSKLNKFIVWGIITFIAFVFVIYGVFTPDNQMGPGSVGSVNGDPIGAQEFSRELENRMRFYRSMNFPEEQLKALRIEESVFEDLVQKRLLIKEAERVKLEPADEAIRKEIRQYPAFQKNGGFNRTLYEEVLKANQMTPYGFEKMIRNSMLERAVRENVQSLIPISDQEVREDLELAQDKRLVKLVHIPIETGQRALKLPSSKVTQFLAKPENAALVKNRYERAKETQYRGKKFEDASLEIASELLAGEHKEEVSKLNAQIASQVRTLLKPGNAKNPALDEFTKKHQIFVRTGFEINRRTSVIQGVGPLPEMVTEVLKMSEPMKAAKIYESPRGPVVMLLDKVEKPDPKKLSDPQSLKEARERLRMTLARGLMDSWFEGLRKSARVKMAKLQR